LFVKSIKSKLLVSSLLLWLLLFSSFSSSFKSFFNFEPSVPFLPTEKEMNQRAEKFLASKNMELLMQKANEKKELSLKNNNLIKPRSNDFSIQSNEIYGPDVIDKDGNWQFGLTFILPPERMVRSSWSNFWLVDTVPLSVRMDILALLGRGNPANTSQKTRDFVLGKTNEFAKGNYGDEKRLHAVYWDRVIPWPVFILLQAALGELVLNQIAKIWDGYKTWRINISEINFRKKMLKVKSLRNEINIHKKYITEINSEIIKIEEKLSIKKKKLFYNDVRINSLQKSIKEEELIDSNFDKLKNNLNKWREENIFLDDEIREIKEEVKSKIINRNEIKKIKFRTELNLETLNREINIGYFDIIMNYLETAFNWLINNLKKFLSAPIIAMSYAVRLAGNIQLANNMYNHPYDYTDGILSYITELWERIKNIPFIGEALGFLVDNDLYTYVKIPIY
jgi:hypothetical protein